MRSYLPKWSRFLRVNKGRPEASALSYQSRVEQFIDFMEKRGRTRPEAVTRADIDDFMEALYYTLKNLSNSTRSGKLSAVRSFFDYLVYTGVLAKNPTDGVPSPKGAVKMPRKFTTAELRKLFQAPDLTRPLGLRDAAVLKTIYGAGLRKSELVDLDLRDVMDSGGYIHLHVRGKGSKERVLTLRRRPAKALRMWLIERMKIKTGSTSVFLAMKGEPERLGGRSITNVLKKYADMVGIPAVDAFVHKLRATWATDLYDAGVGLLEIVAMAGWNDPKTALNYIRISEKALRKAAIPDRRWRELDETDPCTGEGGLDD